MTIGILICIIGIGFFVIGFIMMILEILLGPSRKRDIMEKMKWKY